LNGFQDVGVGEDGMKRDKVKPLSTLDSNKAFKRSCSPHVKHSSLKVISPSFPCSWVVCSFDIWGNSSSGVYMIIGFEF